MATYTAYHVTSAEGISEHETLRKSSTACSSGIGIATLMNSTSVSDLERVEISRLSKKPLMIQGLL